MYVCMYVCMPCNVVMGSGVGRLIHSKTQKMRGNQASYLVRLVTTHIVCMYVCMYDYILTPRPHTYIHVHICIHIHTPNPLLTSWVSIHVKPYLFVLQPPTHPLKAPPLLSKCPFANRLGKPCTSQPLIRKDRFCEPLGILYIHTPRVLVLEWLSCLLS